MSRPRRIHVTVEESELLGYLTGARSLALPEDAYLVSSGFDVVTDYDDGITRRLWWFAVEHASFAEVQHCIPRVSAREFNRMRKPLRSCTTPPQSGRMSRTAAG